LLPGTSRPSSPRGHRRRMQTRRGGNLS
jgi:hypothetical protein